MIPLAPMNGLKYIIPEPVEAVRGKLAFEVEESNSWPRRSGNRKRFYGVVGKSDFRLNLTVDGPYSFLPRNSFHPVAIGRIESAPEGTTVVVRFHRSLTTNMFGFWWHVFWIPPLALSLISGFANHSWIGVLFCGGMLMIFWLLLNADNLRGTNEYLRAFDQVFKESSSSS